MSDAETVQNQASVIDLEMSVWTFEDLRVVIRAANREMVGVYSFQRKASDGMLIKHWIENRLKPCIGGLEFVIIDGRGYEVVGPARNKTLDWLRNSYAR